MIRARTDGRWEVGSWRHMGALLLVGTRGDLGVQVLVPLLIMPAALHVNLLQLDAKELLRIERTARSGRRSEAEAMLQAEVERRSQGYMDLHREYMALQLQMDAQLAERQELADARANEMAALKVGVRSWSLNCSWSLMGGGSSVMACKDEATYTGWIFQHVRADATLLPCCPGQAGVRGSAREDS